MVYKNASSKGHTTLSLAFSMVLLMLGTVLLTAAIIHFPWYFTSRENIANLVAQLNNEIVNSIKREVEVVFKSTTAVQQTLYSLLNQKALGIGSKQKENIKNRELLYLSFLKSNPNITWIVFGWPNGSFFGVQRTNDSLKSIERNWNLEQQRSDQKVRYFHPQDISTPLSEKSKYTEYYAPQRPWYKVAADTNQQVWTDIYIFNTSKKPGINTSISLRDNNNNLLGVASIAISLESISAYLKQLRVSENGSAFIINSQKQLVAFENPEELARSSSTTGKAILTNLNHSSHPIIKIANQALLAQKLSFSQLLAKEFIDYTSPETGDSYFVTLAPTGFYGWITITVIPKSDILGLIEKNQQLLFFAVIGLLVLTIFIVLFLTKSLIINPLRMMTDHAIHLKDFNLAKIEVPSTFITEVFNLSSAISQMRNGLEAFQKYIPTELVRLLIAEGIPARLGGTHKELSILFSDVKGFTSISEQMGDKLIGHLSVYLDEMSKQITEQNGTIDKYIGDAIMAFWGAPISEPQHAYFACKAALRSQAHLQKLHQQWAKEGKPLFSCRIGINTGTVLVGNVGSRTKMDYTVIGDPVNVASRLENLNKSYGTSILIGPSTYEAAQEHIIVRKIDNVAVYGKTEYLAVYELLALKEENHNAEQFYWIQVFEMAYSHYQQQEWDQAINLFRKTYTLRKGGDPLSEIYIARCQHMFKHPPGENWDGSLAMQNK